MGAAAHAQFIGLACELSGHVHTTGFVRALVSFPLRRMGQNPTICMAQTAPSIFSVKPLPDP